MTELIHPPAPPLNAPLQPCARCGAPLAGDQRWCLHCGARRAGVDSPFASAPPPSSPVASAPPPPLRAAPADRTPRWLYGLLAFGVAAVVFALGLLAGGTGADRRTLVNVPPSAAPVVNVTVPSGGGAVAEATPEALASDWPEGKDGWTVQLQALPSEGTDAAAVDAAKADAEDKGAPDVGALLSDDYATLPASRYIVYSGVFPSKAKAAAALKDLRKDFKKAKVVEVSATGHDDEPVETLDQGELEENDNLSPEEFQKKSKKLPDKVGTGGEPPPVDDKPAGGGSGSVDFG